MDNGTTDAKFAVSPEKQSVVPLSKPMTVWTTLSALGKTRGGESAYLDRGPRAGELLAAQGASAERLEQLLAEAIAEWRKTHPALMRRLGVACRAVLDWLRGRA
jgi:hypothetical protein